MIAGLLFPSSSTTLILARNRCRSLYRDAALFSAVLNLLHVAPALYMLQVYDRALPARSGVTLAMLTGMFMMAMAASAGLDLMRARLLVRASERLDRTLAPVILDRLLAGGAGHRTAAILRDFDAARQTLTGAGALALFDAPWTLVYVLCAFAIHPLLGVFLLAAAALLIVLSIANDRATGASIRAAVTATTAQSDAIDEMVRGHEAARALGMSHALATRALDHRRESGRMQASVGFAAASWISASKTARMALQSLSLGIGAWLAIRGDITAGAIFAASMLMARALTPIELITASWRSIVQARASHAAIDRLLATQEPRSPPMLPMPRGDVRVENLSVKAPGTALLILDNLSFELPAGEVVAITGSSGSGKSTLLRAIAGAIEPDHGTVRLDGAALGHWPVIQRSRAIGFLPQSPTLFGGTVRENICRFETDPDSSEARDIATISAAQAAGIHDFVLRLPDGYDSFIGTGGIILSAGQAQRVALARALYADPCLLVLDEPNASLDRDGEEALETAVGNARRRGATVILALHHGALVNQADQMMIMHNGRIERIGQRDVRQRAGWPT